MDCEEEFGIKIFIGCLPADFLEKDLYDYFSSFCRISPITVKYRSNKVCSGHGTFFCLESHKLDFLLNRIHFFKNRCLEVRKNLEGEQHLVYQEEFNKRRLYIQNLPDDVKDIEIIRTFQKIAPVERAYKANRPDKFGNHFGFVILKEKKHSNLVLSTQVYLGGRELKIKMADRAGNQKKKIKHPRVSRFETYPRQKAHQKANKRKKQKRREQNRLKFKDPLRFSSSSLSDGIRKQPYQVVPFVKRTRKPHKIKNLSNKGYAESHYGGHKSRISNYIESSPPITDQDCINQFQSFNRAQNYLKEPDFSNLQNYSDLQLRSHQKREKNQKRNSYGIHLKRKKKGRIYFNADLVLPIHKGIKRISVILDQYHSFDNLRLNSINLAYE